MNNLANKFRRFIKNKNTVTILGVFIIIAILYVGYNSQIQKQVNPVRNIPVAAVTIQPGTLITNDMISYVDISPVVLNHGNVIMNSALVVNKYSDYNTVIPKGSLFYTDVVIEREGLPGSDFVKIKDGDEVFKFAVDVESTYGNSIFPGHKIDIYMKAVNVSGQVMVGKLIENIEVVAVKDYSGNNVFENTDVDRTPAMLVFGLSPANHNLLLKAKYLTNYSIELFPVPHGGTAERPGQVKVTSQALKEFIEAYSVPNDELNEELAPVPDTEEGN